MPEGGFHSEFAVGPEFRSHIGARTLPSHSNGILAGAVLIATDVIVLEFCLYLGFILRSILAEWFPIGLTAPVYAGIAAGLPVVVLCFYFMGLYPGYGISDVERLKHQQTGIAIILSSLLIWDHLAQDGAWSRGIVLLTWIFAALAIPPAFSLVRFLLIRCGNWGMPVVVVGAGDAGEELIELMRRDPRLGLIPTAVLVSDPRMVGGTAAGIPIVGTIEDAGDLAGSIKVCAVAMPELEGQKLADLSSQLPFPHVVLRPNFGNLPSAWVSPRDVGGTLGLEIKKNLLLGRNRIFKRIVEIAFCIPLLLFSMPLLGILAALVCLISPGQPFYAQKREGLDGESFWMFKLRSMYPDAEKRLEAYLRQHPEKRAEWERTFKLQDDPRVLPFIGRFLRTSSLDELPQLLNVLRGEMSLVGPRPFPYYHLAYYPAQFREFRRSVRPGLTGLWQVEVRSDGDIEDQKTHDTYYIRNWSLWLDLYIMFRTVGVVLSRRGAR